MVEPALTVQIRNHIERHLSPDEARAYESAPITAFEREEILALQRWFCTRYPTPLARLTYVRQAYARWQRTAAERPHVDPSSRTLQRKVPKNPVRET